jgi:hypothetical protein
VSKKSSLQFEELTRLILFFIALIFVFLLIKSLLIPIIFEKNKQSFCKTSLSLKNSDSTLKELFGSLTYSSVCNNIEQIEVITDNSDDVLYNLAKAVKKTCDTIKVFDETILIPKDDMICPYSLRIKATSYINLDSNDILQLTNALVPGTNKPIYEYCNNPNIIVDLKGNSLSIARGNERIIKICYYRNNYNEKPTILIKEE